MILSQSITRVYATVILVQLRAMSANTESPSEAIYEAVADVIDALQSVPKGVSLRGVTWPMCVAGAMAAPDQQPFFENLIDGILEKAGDGFTNCDTVLRILKESWKDQECLDLDSSVPKNAMARLGICALLV